MVKKESIKNPWSQLSRLIYTRGAQAKQAPATNLKSTNAPRKTKKGNNRKMGKNYLIFEKCRKTAE